MNGSQWYVLIEENLGDSREFNWRLTHFQLAGDFENALSVARQAAFHYVPKHPMWPQHRSLFRTQDGGWLVLVTGRTKAFHFRVSVAEYYGNFPAAPSA